MTTTCYVVAGLIQCVNVTPVSPAEAVAILQQRRPAIVEAVDPFVAIRAAEFVVPDGWTDHGAIRGQVFGDYVPFSRLYQSRYSFRATYRQMQYTSRAWAGRGARTPSYRIATRGSARR